MSKEIEQRVVEMKFDNSQFEKGVSTSLSTIDKLKKALKLEGATKGLEGIDQAAKKVSGFDTLIRSIEPIKVKFSALESIAIGALEHIGSTAVRIGSKLVSALTIDPVRAGLQEYETQINAVQTILANTSHAGTDLDDVNKSLDELNKYADKTIYNFTEMTRNIGTFTAAGLGLEESTMAIKGIANLAAVSGSTSQQASTAMYQLSQALANGTVNLQDWNSVVNAGMGGKVFQDALVRTAAAMQGVTEETFRANNITGSFRESISTKDGTGWLTADVLKSTLQQFTGDMSDAELASIGFTEAQIENIKAMGVTANDAATKVKTMSQLWDTLKESAQSGWTQTWEIIIGDFEEAKSILTTISDTVGGFLNATNDSRNILLSGAFTSGWKQFVNKGITDTNTFKETIKDVAKEHNVKLDEMITSEKSFEDTLKDGWMTTDILSKSIEKYGEKLANMSEEERKAAGYTDADIEAFKALQTQVKDGTISLDEFTKKMGRLSGREVVIAAFTNVFKGLGTIIKPIGEAFDEIIPKLSSEQLYGFISKFKDLTEKFKIGDETAENLKRTFKGLFSVVNIIKDALFALSKIIAPIVGFIAKLADGILSVTAVIGDYLVLISDVTQRTELFGKIISGLGGIIKPVVEFVKKSISKIADLFKSFDTIDINELESFANKIIEACKPLTSVGDFFEWVFEGLFDILMNIGDFLGKAFGYIKEVVFKIFDADTFGKLASMVTGGLLVKIVTGLNGIVDTIKDFFGKMKGNDDSNGRGGIFDSLTEGLDALKGCLEAYQSSLKANALIKIAIAVGILAASLLTIATIDSDKLVSSTTAIGALMTELVAAMVTFQALSKGKGTKGAIGMVAIAAAVLILASAMKRLGDLNWDQIAKGLASVTGIATVLVASSIMLSKFSGKITKTAFGLILFAEALNLLADVVTKLSEVKASSLIKGLGAVFILCMEIAAFLKLADFGTMSVKGTAGLILLAVAIKVLASSVEKFASIDSNALIQGLFGIGVVIAELLAFLKLMHSPEKMISTATGLVILGGALLVIGEAVRLLGGLNPETLVKGLASIVAILGGIGLGLSTIPTTKIITTSIALTILGGALLLIGETIRKLGGMKTEELMQGIFGLAAALGVIGVAITAMNHTLPGATALIIISAALAVLAPVLKTLGAMNLAEIGKALLALAGAFTVIGIAAAILGPLIPAILGLSGAIVLLGVGCLAAGAGVLAFSAGLAALAVSGSAGVAAIVLLITEVLNLIPLFVQKLGEGLVALCQVIIDSAPVIAKAFLAILQAISDVIVVGAPLITDTILQLLTIILEQIAKYTPRIVQAGVDIIIALLTGINDNIYQITELAIEIMLNFINAIADALPALIEAGVNLIVQFIVGCADALESNKDILSDAIVRLIDSIIDIAIDTLIGCIDSLYESALKLWDSGFVQGIKDTIKTIIEVVASIPSKCLDTIDGFVTNFVDAGANLISGLVNGIKGKITDAIDTAASMASSVITAVKGIFDENSPSKVFHEIGEFLDIGLANGIKDSTKVATRASEALGRDTIKSMNRTINDLAMAEITTNPTIKPVIDLSSVEKGATVMNGLFGSRTLSLGANVDANMTSLSSVMSNSQNRANNNDIIAAINDLNKSIGNMSGDNYNINGITYDDGSNITSAVKSLVRAAKVERRI